jgi:hypothetical protein
MALVEHPIAAMFPMMTKQELDELANDIKQNGLREPIKLSSDGKQIIDGRNRLAACKLAKIEPTFEKLNGEDATAFAISANIARRHMTAGQRAMVAAKIYPDVADKGRGKNAASCSTFPMVDSGTLARARRILHDAPDLVAGVLDGSMPFDRAVRDAKDRADLASSNEHKIAMLREGARDLAELVKEQRMDIDEALAGMKERERKIREIIEHGKQAAESGLSQFLAVVASIAAAVKVSDEKLLDKKKVAAVIKAAEQLQSLAK